MGSVTNDTEHLTPTDRNVTKLPKICRTCKKKADVIVDDEYYSCATCECKRLKIPIK